MAAMIIGVDHGNGNMKTEHLAFCCGFKMQETRPDALYAKDVIKYREKYYSLSAQRFAYATEKYADENAFILTLFAVAKEMVFLSSAGKEAFDFKRDFPGFVGRDIILAVGLPPAHFEKQKDAFKRYFLDKGRNGVDYYYNGKHFCFHIADVHVFPQDYAAAVIYKPTLLTDYPTVYCIDIGDGTVDMVGITEGVPEKETMVSREIGMSRLRASVIDDIINDYGITLTDRAVEDILMGKPAALAPSIAGDIKSRIKLSAENFTTNLVNQLHSKVSDFRVYPCVFCGGGALALREHLIGSGRFGITEFIDDIHANAVGYARLAEAVCLRG